MNDTQAQRRHMVTDDEQTGERTMEERITVQQDDDKRFFTVFLPTREALKVQSLGFAHYRTKGKRTKMVLSASQVASLFKALNV
jgi:hypothetical protein